MKTREIDPREEPSTRPSMRIVPLDPSDGEAMAAWHATYHAADTHGREHATPWMLEEVRARLAAGGSGQRELAWAGVVDGVVATTGSATLPLKDNLDKMRLAVHTAPALRGRGYGTQMLEHLLGVARENGRRTLLAEASYPYAAPADGAGHPDAEFLTRRGFAFALGDVQRVLDLPVDEALLDRLAAEAAPYHRDYTLRTFPGAVPDDIVDSFAALVGLLAVEAPNGEMEWEPEAFDAERVRQDEALFAASGRTKYTAVALAADGSVVAYTDLVVPAHDPGRAYQWGTLADPRHRGHRLGLAVKVANLRWFQAERPDVRVLSTFNAEVNRHMIGVNERLGFRPVDRLGEFQRSLG